MANDECKSLTEWANDPRVPLSRMTLWRAARERRLKASTPVGAKKILIKWSDMERFLSGGDNGEQT